LFLFFPELKVDFPFSLLPARSFSRLFQA